MSSHKISEVSKRKLLHSTHTAALTLLCMKSFGVWAPFSLLLLYAGLQSQDMLLVQNDCSIWSHPFHSLPRKIGERQKEGKRWEYKTTWLASWEICMQVKKQQLRTGHGRTDWFQIGKGIRQGCILSACLFFIYAEYIMQNAGLDEAQAGIKIAGRNINNLR